MKQILMLVPATHDVEISAVSKALANNLAATGKSVVTHCPVATMAQCANPGVPLMRVEELLCAGQDQILLEEIVAAAEAAAGNADILVVEGLVASHDLFYSKQLNRQVATALDAQVVLVSTLKLGVEGAFRGASIEAADMAKTGKTRVVGHFLTGPDANEAAEALRAKGLNVRGSFDGNGVPRFEAVWIEQAAAVERSFRMTPPRFRSALIQKAKSNPKRIVLPEGTEPRTLRAANIVAERGIAVPVLLATPEDLNSSLEKLGITLHPGVERIDPSTVVEKYVAPMVELRKAKGLTDEQARKQLSDEVVLGTMMLKMGDVDGLVSGAVHTTADTVRPALQLIKCKPGVASVSSVFFMCLPDQVMVLGDCAITPNPTVEELAQIAIQSADNAIAFGIDPKVAMISYSTINSGSGEDVELVRAATARVRELRPELPVDGPLQYDAAVVESIGRSKAPNSAVAGQATVLIFPDLNTGNTTYKAVQRSAGVESIGPMLQGLAKPVNDLSRGALVDDIVYTIALTALQAQAQA